MDYSYWWCVDGTFHCLVHTVLLMYWSVMILMVFLLIMWYNSYVHVLFLIVTGLHVIFLTYPCIATCHCNTIFWCFKGFTPPRSAYMRLTTILYGFNNVPKTLKNRSFYVFSLFMDVAPGHVSSVDSMACLVRMSPGPINIPKPVIFMCFSSLLSHFTQNNPKSSETDHFHHF